jgi:hypothetical protein
MTIEASGRQKLDSQVACGERVGSFILAKKSQDPANND